MKTLNWLGGFVVTAVMLSALSAYAAEEQTNKSFPVQTGGKLVVEVDFGSIEVTAHDSNEVVVDAYRKVTRKSRADEEAYLKDHPLEISSSGNVVTVRCRKVSKLNFIWRGNMRNEARYRIQVPVQFNTQLETAGGPINVRQVEGKVDAHTSGGDLSFTGVKGTVEGGTSGGGIRLDNCTGKLSVNTSGGNIQVTSGSGTLDGSTSGGNVKVADFDGPSKVRTSGGNIDIKNARGVLDAETSGGNISASLGSATVDRVTLSTTGGDITVRGAQNAAFNLDASTTGGSVSSEFPVTVTGKVERSHLRGPVNGGGKPVTLRTTGGGIRIKKMALAEAEKS